MSIAMREGRVYAVCRNIKRDIRELARDSGFLIQALERIFAFMIISSQLFLQVANIEGLRRAQRFRKCFCSLFLIREEESEGLEKMA